MLIRPYIALITIAAVVQIGSSALAKEAPKTKICPPGEHWVKAHHRRAYIRSDGSKVSATEVTAHCQKDPIGSSFWKPKLKTGKPPGWERAQEKVGAWTPEEDERVLEALALIPDSLWAKTLNGIYRLGKSVDYPNPASSMSGQIALYDTAFDETRNLTRILAHELAHESYRNLSQDEAKSYGEAANWFNVAEEGKEPIYISRGTGFVSEGAKRGPDEDYANNIEYFLFAPNTLKETTPNVYKWIGQKFGGSFRVGKESPNEK